MNKILYNTEKQALTMSEYGRAIQDMVDYATELENREERQHCAETIVKIMATMSGEKLDNEETSRKLWNHLAIISRFELDIDYPVEILQAEEVNAKPEPMKLPGHKIRRKHYGHLVEQALQYLSTLPEGEERVQLTRELANRMKQSLFTWNPDVMSEAKVKSDMADYSGGVLGDELDGFKFGPMQTISISIKKRKK